MIPLEDIILYHGSRSGIKGDIKPISREECDFGKGFYMGTISEQAKGLVAYKQNPVFYEMKFRLSEIPEERILNLNNNMDWLYTILANRQFCEEFNELEIAKDFIESTKKYDVVIGSIADGGILAAINEFADYCMTDNGLIACLQAVDYGKQYVAKTEFACSKIEILSEHTITEDEKKAIQQYEREKKRERKGLVRKIEDKYINNGLYLDEIIEAERKKEKERGFER